MIRADFIIYYWILFWYVFYVTGYIHQNPAPALWLGLLGNLLLLVAMIYYKVKTKTLLYFVTVIVVTKIIPLWTLKGIPIGKKDIMATIGLVIMYIGWLVWEEKLSVMKQISYDILQDKYSTPAMAGMKRLFP
jgi:hypothetical protein